VFDQNLFRQPLADAEAGVADLAKQAGLATEQLDLLLFAEPHLAQTMRHLRRSGKLLNAHIHPRAHAAERAQKRLGTLLPIIFGAM